ncbi:MAG: amidase [Deltaproteobacteria bacterium]|nr:amidase [Deltaproteobacteria bacterium]
MTPEEYGRHDALGLAKLVRDKEVTALELVELAIAKIEALNPTLNAVVHKMYEQARARAKAVSGGPFAGVPFLVKDMDGFVAGEPCTAGSRARRGFVPDHDSEIVARFKKAGLVITGKTNAPEAGLLAVTEPELFGPTKNPWNPEHTPGGSSGGSAAAVAARLVPMAHGGDGGGSIRIPASACGLFGLKPTRGRNPVGPDAGEGWSGLVSIHALTRSVRDCAALLDAVSGPEEGAPYVAPPASGPFAAEVGKPPGALRIAFHSGSLFGRNTHPDCVAAVTDAAKLAAELGHVVTETAPVFAKEELVRAYLVVVAAGMASFVAETERLLGRKVRSHELEPSSWFLCQVGRALSALDLEQARAATCRAGRAFATFFHQHDLFLTPTLAYPPVKIGELALKAGERFGLALLRALPARPLLNAALSALAANALEKTPNTMLFNQTGQPAMSVPLYWNAANLPIGVQFVGRFGDEATLLRLGAQLEAARPWSARLPAVV